jgi:hypothetical protein
MPKKSGKSRYVDTVGFNAKEVCSDGRGNEERKQQSH